MLFFFFLLLFLFSFFFLSQEKLLFFFFFSFLVVLLSDADPALEALMAKVWEPEDLRDDNQYACTTCQAQRDAVRTVRIVEAPECLVITLLRFRYDKTVRRRKMKKEGKKKEKEKERK